MSETFLRKIGSRRQKEPKEGIGIRNKLNVPAQKKRTDGFLSRGAFAQILYLLRTFVVAGHALYIYCYYIYKIYQLVSNRRETRKDLILNVGGKHPSGTRGDWSRERNEAGVIFVTEQTISLNQRKFTRFVLFYLSGEIYFAIYDTIS